MKPVSVALQIGQSFYSLQDEEKGGNVDLDGDGMGNLMEAFFGTDPHREEESPFEIVKHPTNSNQLQLLYPTGVTAPFLNASIKRSDDLTDFSEVFFTPSPPMISQDQTQLENRIDFMPSEGSEFFVIEVESEE